MAHTSTTDQPQSSRATEAYKIVQRYNGSNRSSIEQDLRQLLGMDVGACGSYTRMLDEDDEQRGRIEEGPSFAEDREGGRVGQAAEGGRPLGRNPLDSREAERGSRKEKSQLDHYHNGQRRRRRRLHRRTPSSSSSDSASDSNNDYKPHRPNSSLFAWASQPAVRPELDHRSILKQTMDARNNYTKGGKVGTAVRDLLEHGNLPNFPTSKWKTVLSDDYMDLKKVIGGVESAIGDYREVTIIGGLEIGYGREPPSKAIVSANDWATAFNLYRGAVVFAFPHRHEELLAYRDYINDTFRVFGPHHHPAVIKFDQRCRNLYSRTHARALSDISQFASEYSRLTARVAEAAASSSPLAQDLASDPICYSYNYATCSGCSYRHVCLICEQPEHVADDCPEKPRPGQLDDQHGESRQSEDENEFGGVGDGNPSF